MKYINNYVLHTGDMITTNKCLEMSLSHMFQKVLNDTPDAEIAISVKFQPHFHDNVDRYKIEICFSGTEEHENILAYMNMSENNKPTEFNPVLINKK